MVDTRPVLPPQDTFTAGEQQVLERYFTNTDRHVFALTDLPEVVKGALFARYSRSRKSIRRLFLDEFLEHLPDDSEPTLEGSEGGIGARRATDLYQRVFTQYGDDSVAQLGGAHLAMEEVSNLATKRIEWGRLAAYLEQSTRYIPYDQRPGGRYRYYRDPDVMAGPHARVYVDTLDHVFDTYARLLPEVLEWVRQRFPRDQDQTSAGAWKRATRAKALDLLRGLLPAATTANVGMFASGQAYEHLLLRLNSDELAESQALADEILTELRKVIPAFLTRVDREDRGVVWSEYLAETRRDTRRVADELLSGGERDRAAPVTLVDWSPRDPEEAELELVTAMLYAASDLPEIEIRREVADMTAAQRQRVIEAYVGDRRNRRHKPGRALERLWYRFDVLGDYGGFRDLQRHRMLTIEWQRLTPEHGYVVPPQLEAAGFADDYREALERSADLYGRLVEDHPVQAQYAVCFAYRVRYVMQLNARAAMQMLELRSTPQGHPAYRSIVQEMHRLIREKAGHAAVANAMSFVDHGAAELERLDAERRAEARRRRRDLD